MSLRSDMVWEMPTHSSNHICVSGTVGTVSVHKSVGRSVNRLVDRSVIHLIGQSAGWLVNQPII